MLLASPLPLYAFDSATEPRCLLTERTTWLFDLPNFHRFEWPVLVVDTTDMDDTILGYDYLRHWNPIIDWHEGLITPRASQLSESDALRSVELDLNNPTRQPTASSRIPSASCDLQALDSRSISSKSIDEPTTTDAFLCASTTGKSYEPFEAAFFDEASEDLETILPLIPTAFHDFIDIFSKVKADTLPPRRACDHQIELTGDPPRKGGVYKLSDPEDLVLREYISEHVQKGFIRPSKSPVGAGVLFVPKKDGGLRLCVDYRRLNEVTRKNSYPIPPMSHLLTNFHNAKFFTKIDLRGAYHLVRIAEGHEYLTAFNTRHGSYEYLVMPFGLTNAPATFQALMNEILGDLVNTILVCYLDDTLIFSPDAESDVVNTRTVLQRFKDNNLYVNASKCVFHATSTAFLGFVVSPSGLTMDEDKVRRILDWPPPQSVKQLQQFLGFANFYRRFIKDYS